VPFSQMYDALKARSLAVPIVADFLAQIALRPHPTLPPFCCRGILAVGQRADRGNNLTLDPAPGGPLETPSRRRQPYEVKDVYGKLLRTLLR